MYVVDYDDRYPAVCSPITHPEIADVSGGILEARNKSPFIALTPYLKNNEVLDCPSDTSQEEYELTSYLINGYFAFGAKVSDFASPEDVIMIVERRTEPVDNVPVHKGYLYHPWFNPSNPSAPRNDMHPDYGAIATRRHKEMSGYVYADGHAQFLEFSRTYDPANNIDRHRPK